MSNLRDEFAKIVLSQIADRVLDPKFNRESSDAGCDPCELIAGYCYDVADAMMKLSYSEDQCRQVLNELVNKNMK